jgi:hypothetical protein
MMTSADRLRWYIDFARVHSRNQELKEWQVLKLRDEIIEFVAGSEPDESFRFQLKDRPIDQIITRESIIRLAEQARNCLTVLFVPSLTSKDNSPPRLADLLNWQKAFVYLGSPSIWLQRSSATFLIESNLQSLLFIRFAFVLKDEGASQIERCPECCEFFYRVRKQVYCSKTCINRVSRRNWLKNAQNRKKDREWARKRYERRVKNKTNVNVKVRSRTKGRKTK